MYSYLINTKFAAESVFGALLADDIERDGLLEQHRVKTSDIGQYHLLFLQQQRHPNVYYWASQQRDAEERRQNISVQIATIEQSICDKTVSLAALSGALLQLARQGISMVHEGLPGCPGGRSVHGIALKRVIWAGRNLADHFEEREIHDPTRVVFGALQEVFPDKNLDPIAGISLAHEMLRVLEWSSYERYEADMVILLG